MSPEQILGQRGDQRMDVYSWGVLMYELLTARRPFEGDDDLSTMEAQLKAQPEAPRVLRPEVPPALEAVVMKAMRRRAEERFPSALALLEALDQLDGSRGSGADSSAVSDDPPLSGTMAVGEGVDVLRLIAVVFVGFVSFVTVVIAASVAFR
jgi:serine/threonine-protein kinase